MLGVERNGQVWDVFRGQKPQQMHWPRGTIEREESEVASSLGSEQLVDGVAEVGTVGRTSG